MKKKPDSGHESKYYEGTKLYRDHVELILSIFEANGYGVTIDDGELEYDSLDELIEKRGTMPSKFSIEGKSGNQDERGTVSFSLLERGMIMIFLSAYDGKTAYKIFMGIRDVCESRSSKLYKILNPWGYLPIWFILAVCYVALLDVLPRTPASAPRRRPGTLWVVPLNATRYEPSCSSDWSEV